MAGSPTRPVQNDLSSPTPLPKSTPRPISGGVNMAISPTPRALFFDVFGTCVDWRTTVVGELNAQAHARLNDATASLASRVRLTMDDMTMERWGEFAQQWRNGYKKFTRQLASDPSVPWKSVDEHHLESLKQLVEDWQLSGLWDEEQLRAISLIWHRLDPWADSALGVSMLNRLFCKFQLLTSDRMLTLQTPALCRTAISVFLGIFVLTAAFPSLTSSRQSCLVPTSLRHVCTSGLPKSCSCRLRNVSWWLRISTIFRLRSRMD